jgi:hypothetical protein
VDTEAVARRWRDTWQRAWPERDADAIVALYADSVPYRALAFREPDMGLAGVRGYLEREFGVETEIECRFGEPVVAGDRAAVEWWASWDENGKPLTLAGSTFLRFDENGLVIDHRDYWNQVERREPPYEGWHGRSAFDKPADPIAAARGALEGRISSAGPREAARSDEAAAERRRMR